MIFFLYVSIIFKYDDKVQLLPDNDPYASKVIVTLNAVINSVNLKDNASIQNARQILTVCQAQSVNDSKTDSDVYVLGHCHIDTAWLWPYAETRRKVSRSWSTQLCLLEKYPNWVFAASQSVHYEWLSQDYPELFQRVKAAIVGEGRFVPIGGSYVEFDANIPSGESMIRQLLYGN